MSVQWNMQRNIGEFICVESCIVGLSGIQIGILFPTLYVATSTYLYWFTSYSGLCLNVHAFNITAPWYYDCLRQVYENPTFCFLCWICLLVALMDLGFATHAVHMDQRFVGLVSVLSADQTTLEVTGPPSSSIYPPGPAYLYVVTDSGVPSFGHKTLIGTGASPPVDEGAIAKWVSVPRIGLRRDKISNLCI